MSEHMKLYEVFIRSKRGLDHKHVGSLHAEDPQQALEYARDIYTRRSEGVSIWVVNSSDITAPRDVRGVEVTDPRGNQQASSRSTQQPTKRPLSPCAKHSTRRIESMERRTW